MQFISALFLALATACAADASADTGDRTITRVVKLLQDMLDKSKADGDEERTLYGKYKCYCDKNEAEKKESIDSLTEQIGLLESNIQELQGSNGVLSSEVAQLQTDMAANKQSREEAQKVRDDENADFVAFEKDSKDAIKQMIEAIDVLSAIGADQTLAESAADHDRFMKGSTAMVSLHKVVRQALVAASAFTSKKQERKVESFLQAPFTGTYTAQAGEVVGILKDMRDTFESNLASATTAEKKAQEAHDKFMATMLAEHGVMENSYETKQDELSANDDSLSSKKTQLTSAESTKASDEEFLASLLDMCAKKATDYDERSLLRKNEEAAIAEAISILNSDAAFETFGKVSATSTGATSFLQRALIHRHASKTQQATAVLAGDAQAREQVQKLLRQATKGKGSSLLNKVMVLLDLGNPFKVVLAEIEKMLKLIGDEAKVDQEQLDWCNKERQTNNDNLAAKKDQIIALESAIGKLDTLIDNPETGLKRQIEDIETGLSLNSQSQTTETAERKKAKELYEEDIKHLVEAGSLLTSAISVLEKYYAKILKDEESLLQAKKEEPAPPSTWENGSFKGQSGQGTDAISMLTFILDETKKEEEAAHKDENEAQAAYEDSMTMLKEQEKGYQELLASLQKTLAEKEQELVEAKADLKTTIADKEAIEAYLLKIKPGCDFITENKASRDGNRMQESASLAKARELLIGTPAYQSAVASAHNETLGDCLGTCAGAEEHVACKACLAKVTEPAYCAGHPDTEGC